MLPVIRSRKKRKRTEFGLFLVGFFFVLLYSTRLDVVVVASLQPIVQRIHQCSFYFCTGDDTTFQTKFFPILNRSCLLVVVVALLLLFSPFIFFFWLHLLGALLQLHFPNVQSVLYSDVCIALYCKITGSYRPEPNNKNRKEKKTLVEQKQKRQKQKRKEKKMKSLVSRLCSRNSFSFLVVLFICSRFPLMCSTTP